MKKRLSVMFAILSLMLVLPLTKEVSAEEVPFNNSTSFEKVSPYKFEATYKPLDPTGRYYLDSGTDVSDFSEPSDITVTIDFSESTFYDDEGNVVDKDEVMETIIPVENDGYTTYGASYTPGTLTTGSGYAVNRGMKITGRDGKGVLNISFKANVTRGSGIADRIDRIYGSNVWGAGNWDWLADGVFRRQESGGYSAYGGVKGQWQVSGYGTATKYLYLRVRSGKMWLDHNIK